MTLLRAVRILCMEDDAGTARLLQKSLSRAGYVVDLAADGEQGLAMYEAGSYDVVCVDHKMPGKSGLEVIRALSARGTLPPTIMVTGEGDEAVAVEAMTLGASDYIIKDAQNRYLELMPSGIERALEKDHVLQEKRQAEEALKRAHNELERRVEQRTAQLAKAMEELRREIAVRTQAEAGIRRQNEFLDSVLESLTHPFYVIDANDYTIVKANSASDLNPLTGESTCYSLTHQRDEPCAYPECPCPLEKVKRGKKPVQVEHVHYDQKGKPRYVEIHAYPIFDPEGKVTQVIEYALDITDRKDAECALRESEERFRTIFESASDCIYVKDPSGRYSLVNPAMSALLSLPASSIVGKTDEELLGREAAEHSRDTETRVLAGEIVEEEHTSLIQGFPATLLRTTIPLRNADGNVVAICGVCRNITDRKQSTAFLQSVGSEYHSTAMCAVLAEARLVAQNHSIVLLTGESGSGKDYLAEYIHRHSLRSGGPFFSINCAAVPPELAESELFGHEAGAFTGAARRKRGLLEMAEGGTLLLNEISELPLPLQAKLLTFLDTRQFTRVGAERATTVNARLIAATNRNLDKQVSQGRFRRDLFYRLNVFSIRVP
ncbi:MAG: sigma 54-interacting transcriptional regulator, partial [Deltaproteobacteria bacterium]